MKYRDWGMREVSTIAPSRYEALYTRVHATVSYDFCEYMPHEFCSVHGCLAKQDSSFYFEPRLIFVSKRYKIIADKSVRSLSILKEPLG